MMGASVCSSMRVCARQKRRNYLDASASSDLKSLGRKAVPVRVRPRVFAPLRSSVRLTTYV
jgi:hypothetical protein